MLTKTKTATKVKLNLWDLLANRFDTHKHEKDIHPDAAVNIHIGWPIFIKELEKQKKLLSKDKLNILDFGCGAGELCKKLFELKNNVVGEDKSQGMLDIAREKLPKTIKLFNEEEFANNYKKFESHFDAITAMHVFEWNKNVDEIIKTLVPVLNKNGLFIFAVFPKEHIVDSIFIKDLFEEFDSDINPTTGYANFDGVKVPVYIHDAAYYDKIFSNLGFTKELEVCPGYTKTFLEKYKWTGSHKPEMMILAYRKL